MEFLLHLIEVLLLTLALMVYFIALFWAVVGIHAQVHSKMFAAREAERKAHIMRAAFMQEALHYLMNPHGSDNDK